MSDTMSGTRPRRSALYLPASNERAMAKARSLPADILILDLEDAVAPDAKVRARAAAVSALRERETFQGQELVVRINGPDTSEGRPDLEAVAAARPDAILLPKVESAEDIEHARRYLASTAATVPLWCMIETPRGVLNVAAVADHPAVSCLVMGTSDLTKDLHARPTPDRLPMLHALGQSLLAARAAGIVILDGVHLDLHDAEGFAAACRQGRDLGFDGKTVIHPRQIETANAVFGPDDAEIVEAMRIIAAFDAARAAGNGVALLDGKLIETLHVTEAQRIMALAAAIADRDQARS